MARRDLAARGVQKALAAACKAEGSQRAWAKKHGLPSGRVSEVLSGVRPPPEAICEALGIERVVKYFRKESS